jgi:hypothetical protein
MRKQLINEIKRMQVLAGIITENQYKELNENQNTFKEIFTQYVQGLQNSNIPDEEKQNVDNIINKARYNNIDELVNSIYDVEDEIADIFGHYSGDFTLKTAQNLNSICDNIGLPEADKLELLHAFLKKEWDRLDVDVEEQEEEWNAFLSKIKRS